MILQMNTGYFCNAHEYKKFKFLYSSIVHENEIKKYLLTCAKVYEYERFQYLDSMVWISFSKKQFPSNPADLAYFQV